MGPSTLTLFPGGSTTVGSRLGTGGLAALGGYYCLTVQPAGKASALSMYSLNLFGTWTLHVFTHTFLPSSLGLVRHSTSSICRGS